MFSTRLASRAWSAVGAANHACVRSMQVSVLASSQVSRRHNGTGSYDQLTKMRIPMPWIDALQNQREKDAQSAQNGESASPQLKIDLTPKRMSDSFTRIVLPLAEDKWLLDKYLNVNGDIRLGTIMMDLDALSGVVAGKHTGGKVMTVTAAVDRINIQNPLQEICNLELSGQVTFATGRSSVEISLQVAKEPAAGMPSKVEDIILTCAFTMVSLNPETRKPTDVPALRLETDKERNTFHLGELNYNAKKAVAKTALRKMVPNEEESAIIHSMWLRQLEYSDSSNATSKPINVAYMDSTRIQSTQIMQPQFRNRHNFMIFGGYLMQQTFELAFTCAAAFSHTRPTFLSLDPSTFQNPVPVGSVLYLTATVAYTEAADHSDQGVTGDDSNHDSEFTRVQVRVDSSVRSVEHGNKKPTGQFNYTFLIEKDMKVMPRTYQEFMIWTDARRRARKVNASFDQGNEAVRAEGARTGGDDGKAQRMTE